jgi:two-component system, OmpR family, sensor kinase
VTGVTVGLLAVGLFVAGFGTQMFLRAVLVQSVDDNLRQQVSGPVIDSVFEAINQGGIVTFTPRDQPAPSSNLIVAVYSPEGELLNIFDSTSNHVLPEIPGEWSLQRTYAEAQQVFTLRNAKSGAEFQATVDFYEVDGFQQSFTQMLIQPLAPTERVVAAYVGIYSIVALLILIASALLTRWLVTLTFRGLGQVETTAMAIAAGDFGQRMTDVVPGTEVGRLKSAINTMLGRVDGAIRQRDATVRQMRRFIGDASHELRTPLVTVRGYAELYRMGAIRTEDDIAQSMERIEKEAIRMGVLVEDLLALARLDERRDVAITPIDLRPLARDAALDLRAASPLREVTVEDTTGADGPRMTIEIVPDAPEPVRDETRRRGAPATSAIAIAGAAVARLRRRPRSSSDADAAADAPAPSPETVLEPVVLGDENRIRQVIANLLGNARRFTADDSPIGLRVGVSALHDMGWIEVIDHGEGIPEQIREQIFQRFWRADTSRARETGGSGLGLSIVASIVDALHGTVDVTDTPGGGATFRVSFPLARQRSADEHALVETQPLARPPSEG